MPVMIDMPIASADVPRVDAILVTHSDNDHYSVPTCRALAPVTARVPLDATYVASLMQNEGWPAHGHAIGDTVDIGPVRVEADSRQTMPGRTHPRGERPRFPT